MGDLVINNLQYLFVKLFEVINSNETFELMISFFFILVLGSADGAEDELYVQSFSFLFIFIKTLLFFFKSTSF